MICVETYQNMLRLPFSCFLTCVSPSAAEKRVARQDSSSFYAGILSYGIAFALSILVAVMVMIYKIKRPAKKAMNATAVQKVSKFPLKRQVTESRYKISVPLYSLCPPCVLLIC